MPSDRKIDRSAVHPTLKSKKSLHGKHRGPDFAKSSEKVVEFGFRVRSQSACKSKYCSSDRGVFTYPNCSESPTAPNAPKRSQTRRISRSALNCHTEVNHYSASHPPYRKTTPEHRRPNPEHPRNIENTREHQRTSETHNRPTREPPPRGSLGSVDPFHLKLCLPQNRK